MTQIPTVTELDDELPSSGLLSFYDRLRTRVERYCERRGGRLGKATVELLLLVPDVFIMLVRMTLDRDVPKEYRTLIASTLAYFILPIDLFPEAVLGPMGFMDDLVIASGVLAGAFGGEIAPYAARHWSGSRRLQEVLADVSQTATALLGESVSGRVDSLLARFGVELEDVPTYDAEPWDEPIADVVPDYEPTGDGEDELSRLALPPLAGDRSDFD